MKRITYILLPFVLALLATGCKEDKATLFGPGLEKQPVLDAINGNYILDETMAETSAQLFSWSKADFGGNSGVEYSIEIDKKDNNFQSPISMGVTNSDTLSVTVGKMNEALMKLEAEADASAEYEIRIKAAIAQKNGGSLTGYTVYSAPRIISATPYQGDVTYDHLNVPGSYATNDWNGKGNENSRIYSAKGNDIYEGYLMMVKKDGTVADPIEFKFTKVDWGNGEYSVSGDGKLVSGGGDNIQMPQGGYYWIIANIPALTYSALLTNWAVIGSATPNGTDTDTPLTYDPETKLLKATLDLTAGSIKFRSNGSWDAPNPNYGAKPGSLKLISNGESIEITEAGKYEIILDFTTPVFKYRLIKQ